MPNAVLAYCTYLFKVKLTSYFVGEYVIDNYFFSNVVHIPFVKFKGLPANLQHHPPSYLKEQPNLIEATKDR